MLQKRRREKVSKSSFLPRNYRRKLIEKILALNIIMYLCLEMLLPMKTFAAQRKYPYSAGSLSSYYGYDTLLQNLKAKHPNWNFTILETGLDWNDVIKNETVAVHGRNLIYYTNTGSWVCSTCGDRTYDSGR